MTRFSLCSCRACLTWGWSVTVSTRTWSFSRVGGVCAGRQAATERPSRNRRFRRNMGPSYSTTPAAGCTRSGENDDVLVECPALVLCALCLLCAYREDNVEQFLYVLPLFSASQRLRGDLFVCLPGRVLTPFRERPRLLTGCPLGRAR